MTKDPVCGMTVDDKAPDRSTHAGRTIVFCCSTCKAKFDKEPARYAAVAENADQVSKEVGHDA